MTFRRSGMLSVERLATIPAWQLFVFAVFTRVVGFALLHCASAAVEDYDSGAALYSPSLRLVEPAAHWDAVHFHHIAAHGYTHEHLHAFFPAVPLLIRVLGSTAACGVMYASFGIAVVLLRELSRTSEALLGSERPKDGEEGRIGWSIAFMLLSPASVFTFAMYTESLFAAFSFAGMLLVTRGQNLAASLFFALATTTRSNGILLAGFFAFPILLGRSADGRFTVEPRISLRSVGRVVGAAVTVTPYLAVNYFGYRAFCAEAHAAGCPPQWTGFYAYIQKKYWNVGWFSYYTANNIPNFFIAAPLYVLVVSAIAFRNRKALLGNGKFDAVPGILRSPQLLYLLGMLAIALTRMHVQVVTRFVFSCPALYWLAGSILSCPGRGRHALLLYCATWIALGTAMFSNFLPWT